MFDLPAALQGLHHPEYQYAPLASDLSAGYSVSCKDLVRAAYVLGVRAPQDMALHLAALPEKRLDSLYKRLRLALAYTQMALQEAGEFGPGVLEFDSTACSTLKKNHDKRGWSAAAKAAVKRWA